MRYITEPFIHKLTGIAHGFEIGLVAVVARSEVADGADGEALALFRVCVLATVVPQTLKQLPDGVLVVADEVRVLGDVVAVPACTQRMCIQDSPFILLKTKH